VSLLRLDELLPELGELKLELEPRLERLEEELLGRLDQELLDREEGRLGLEELLVGGV
jgi:hypothetical protein